MRHKEQNQAGIPGHHVGAPVVVRRVPVTLSSVMRDSGPSCGGLYTILGLSWDGSSLLLCMCVRAYVYVRVCGGQRSTLGLIAPARDSPNGLDWLAREPQGPAVCTSPVLESEVSATVTRFLLKNAEDVSFRRVLLKELVPLCLHQLNQPGKVPSNSTFLIYSILFVPWDSHISVCCLTAHS